MCNSHRYWVIWHENVKKITSWLHIFWFWYLLIWANVYLSLAKWLTHKIWNWISENLDLFMLKCLYSSQNVRESIASCDAMTFYHFVTDSHDILDQLDLTHIYNWMAKYLIRREKKQQQILNSQLKSLRMRYFHLIKKTKNISTLLQWKVHKRW